MRIDPHPSSAPVVRSAVLLQLSALLFFLVLSPATGLAAPIIAPGQMTRFVHPGDLPEDGIYGGALQLRLFREEVGTPTMTDRFPWRDPDSGEERHKTRSWQTGFESTGIEMLAGLVRTNACTLYGVVGMANTDLVYNHVDETNTEPSGDNKIPYEARLSFSDDGRVYFGGGVTATMGRWQLNDDWTSVLDVDLRYRFQQYRPEKDARNRSYRATYHDAQLSAGLALEGETWTPFAGFRISYLKGSEDFKDPARGLHSNETVDPGQNMGYYYGIRYKPTRSFWDVTVAYRSGDEAGWEIGTGVMF